MRRSARQEQILDQLVGVFLAEGFAGFSVEDLAVRLKCSKSTLYGLAPSKEQLFTLVVRAFFRRATEHVEAAVAAESDPVRRIATYLGAIAAELAPATTAFYADLDALRPTREIYARNTTLAGARVQRLVAQAAPGGDAASAAFLGAAAAAVMESIQQGRLRSLSGPGGLDGMDDASAYRSLADLIVAGLGAGR